MLKIAVFDTAANAVQWEDILVNILFDKCEFGLETYTNPKTALETDFAADFDFDIVFINIDSGVFPGMDIARKIRGSGNIKTELVLFSEDESYALYGYKLRCFDYLVKPVSLKTLAETLDRYFYFYELDDDNYFSFKVSGAIQKIHFDDVFYFTSSGRKCIIVNTRADCEFYAKLDEIEAQLDADNFVRVHQSYIVNIRYIKSMTKDGLTLSNGLFVPISQRRYAQAKAGFMKYLNIQE